MCSSDLLLYDFVHVRLLDFSSVRFLHFCASRLEFRMYLCAHAFYIRTQARSMCTHTTDLCTLAYVCAHIVVPRNPNLGFLLGFSVCIFEIYHVRLNIVENLGFETAPKRCEIHSKPQSLMQKTCLS